MQAPMAANAIQLIQRTATQDREAFSQLYDHFSSLVFTLAMRMLRGRDDAEDLLQEVFVQVWRQASALQPRPRQSRSMDCQYYPQPGNR